MATKKVVQELITKWKYKVDASEIKRTSTAIKGLKKNFSDVRRSSVAFGKGEFTRIRRIKAGWRGLNQQVTAYRRNLSRPTKGGRGGMGGMFGGGRGTGRAGLGQSGAFLAGRMLGSTALTSALLGGPILAGGFGGLKAVQAAGERQKQQVAFGGLLGGGPQGARASNVMMERLNKFAVETPFQIDDLRDLARQSIGGGIGFEAVIPQLRKLGDVTSGNIAHLKRMLANMIEIKNTGRANLRDVRQFGRVGIPIYEALAKVTKKTTGQISEMITKGKIGFKEVTAALTMLTSKGGRFHQAMKLQMGTMLGQWSNLGDAIIVMAEKVGKPFLKPLTAAIKTIKGAIEYVTPSLESFAVGVGGVVEFLQYVWETTPMIRHFFYGVGAGLAGVALALSPVLLGFTALYLVLEDFGVYMQGGRSAFGLFLKAYEDLTNLDWGDVGEGIWITIKETLTDVGEWLKSAPGRLFNSFLENAAKTSVKGQAPAGSGHAVPGKQASNTVEDPNGVGLGGNTAVAFHTNTTIQTTPDQLPNALKSVTDENERVAEKQGIYIS